MAIFNSYVSQYQRVFKFLNGAFHILNPVTQGFQNPHRTSSWLHGFAPAVSRPEFVTSAPGKLHVEYIILNLVYCWLIHVDSCPHQNPWKMVFVQPKNTSGLHFPALRVKAWDGYFLSAAYQWSPADRRGWASNVHPPVMSQFSMEAMASLLWWFADYNDSIHMVLFHSYRLSDPLRRIENDKISSWLVLIPTPCRPDRRTLHTLHTLHTLRTLRTLRTPRTLLLWSPDWPSRKNGKTYEQESSKA